MAEARALALLLLAAGCVDSIDGAGASGAACDVSEDCAATEVCGADSRCTACRPISCESAGRDCGLLPDGCRTVLRCGSCAADEACDLEGHCALSDAGLCAQAHACGEVDLRGRAIDCGACSAGACEAHLCCSCGAPPGEIPCSLPCQREEAPQGPAPRYGPSLAALPGDGRTFLFGGEDAALRNGVSSFGDLWSLSPGGAWVEESPAGDPPTPRAKAGFASVGDALLLFGGWEGWGSNAGLPCTFDELFQLRREAGVLTWSKIDPGPGPRPLARLEAAVTGTDDGRLFLYGGLFVDLGNLAQCGTDTDLPSRIYGDLWSFDGVGWTEHPILGPTPSPRAGASLLHDPARGKLVLFGGGNADSRFDDTWEYDLATQSWEERSPAHRPPARTEHAAAWSGGGAIVFGGNVATGLSVEDLWRWDGDDWTELSLPADRPAPTRRRCASLAGAGDNAVLLFGGFCIDDCPPDSDRILDETWLLPVP